MQYYEEYVHLNCPVSKSVKIADNELKTVCSNSRNGEEAMLKNIFFCAKYNSGWRAAFIWTDGQAEGGESKTHQVQSHVSSPLLHSLWKSNHTF